MLSLVVLEVECINASAIMLCIDILIFVILGPIMLFFDESSYANFDNAVCHYTEYRNVRYAYAESCSVLCYYTEFLYA